MPPATTASTAAASSAHGARRGTRKAAREVTAAAADCMTASRKTPRIIAPSKGGISGEGLPRPSGASKKKKKKHRIFWTHSRHPHFPHPFNSEPTPAPPSPRCSLTAAPLCSPACAKKIRCSPPFSAARVPLATLQPPNSVHHGRPPRGLEEQGIQGRQARTKGAPVAPQGRASCALTCAVRDTRPRATLTASTLARPFHLRRADP